MTITRTQAVSAAIRLTGLSGSLTAVEQSTTPERVPFLAEQLATLAGGVWQLSSPELRLTLPSAAAGVRDSYARRAVIRLSKGSGQLLSATLHASEPLPPDVRPTPQGDAAQAQLEQAGEHYAGLPAIPPGCSLVQALDRVLSGGIGSPLLAREIHALYVMHSRRGGSAVPAWVITLNGIPALPHKGPAGAAVPVWFRNHIRNVVDARSGVPLFATTVPQPAEPSSSRPLV